MNNPPHGFRLFALYNLSFVLVCGHFLGLGKEGQWLKRRTVANVIERVRARYEVQDVELGKVYKWRPEHIVVECQCRKKLSLTASATSCTQCGTDHVLTVKEASTDRHHSDQTLHPWRYSSSSSEEDREGVSLPF
jgi:uncharacterized protein YlxP (DUF503 family)